MNRLEPLEPLESSKPRGMPEWRLNLYALVMAVFLIMCSFSMVLPFLPQYLKGMGVNAHLETWSGLILGASFFAGAIMSPVWGALGDRYGQKSMVIRSGVSIAVVNLLMALASTPYHLLVLRVLNGLLGGFMPASQALVAAMVPDREMAFALGLVQVSVAAGGISGPVIGGAFADTIGMRLTFVAASLMVGLATLIVVVLIRPPRRPKMRLADGGHAAAGCGLFDGLAPALSGVLPALAGLMRRPGVRQVLAVVLVTQVTAMSVQPVMALIIEGMARKSVSLLTGVVLSAAGLATLIATPLWTRLSHRFGPDLVIWTGLLGAGFTTVWQGVAASAAGMGAARFWFGFFHCGASQMTNVVLARVAGAGLRGSAYGLASSVWMLGGVVGPAIGGLLASLYGLRAPFWFNALLLALTALWVWRLVTRRRFAA